MSRPRPPVAQELLHAALLNFSAAHRLMCLWQMVEAPAQVRATRQRLEGTKTLDEFIAALQAVVSDAGDDGHGR
jgi:hypothetical protein